MLLYQISNFAVIVMICNVTFLLVIIKWKAFFASMLRSDSVRLKTFLTNMYIFHVSIQKSIQKSVRIVNIHAIIGLSQTYSLFFFGGGNLTIFIKGASIDFGMG